MTSTEQFGAFARIGVALTNAVPCRYFYAAEGLGLTSIMRRRAYSDLGSGRVVHYNTNLFKKAKVWVSGSQTAMRKFILIFSCEEQHMIVLAAVKRNFTQLSYEGQNTFDLVQYRYPTKIGMYAKLVRSFMGL